MVNWLRNSIVIAAVLGAAAAVVSQQSSAQEPALVDPGVVPIQPSPFDLVSNLDLACHEVEGGATPARSVRIDHLNPVLREMGVPGLQAELGRLEQLCTPVAKNQVIPRRPALAYVRWIDLACYEARSEPTENYELKLSHLNPVLREMGLPAEKVTVGALEQVCVPVAKNGVAPPDDVLRVVEHVDVACYEIRPHDVTREFRLHLTHLNPVLRRLGLTEDKVTVGTPEQLCVPVAKNGHKPPDGALRYVRWMDLKKYEAKSSAERRPIPLTLSHLNPQYASSSRFDIELWGIDQLAVPVAKNGQVPPDWDVGPAD